MFPCYLMDKNALHPTDTNRVNAVHADEKHSVNFLLNSNSSLPRLPLPTSPALPPSSHLAPPTLDDVTSSSTGTETVKSPFEELLTAAQLLEHVPTQIGTLNSTTTTTSQTPTPPRNFVDSSLVVRENQALFTSPAFKPSPVSSVASSGGVTKRRRKRASVPCDVCGRMFGEAAAVRKHKRVVHMKVKDFACSICSRKFAEKSNLKKHIQARHQQTRAHKCNECGKVFNFTDGLRRHINNCHLGLRPYKCDICPSSFKQRTHLQKHKQSVHNIKPTPKRGSASVPNSSVVAVSVSAPMTALGKQQTE